MSRTDAENNARTRAATTGDVEDMIAHLRTPPKTDLDLTTLIETVAVHDEAITVLNAHANILDRNTDTHDKAIDELTLRVAALEDTATKPDISAPNEPPAPNTDAQ